MVILAFNVNEQLKMVAAASCEHDSIRQNGLTLENIFVVDTVTEKKESGMAANTKNAKTCYQCVNSRKTHF